jgi:biotin synthase
MSQQSDYDIESVRSIYQLPFNDLLYKAHQVHREHHPANKIQVAELLSIKTGACPEDCGYCSQSGHFKTHVEKEKLLPVDTVIEKAKAAKARGATRYCMGAAWRHVPDKAMPQLKEMIEEVKGLGLETCMTLGMLNEHQAKDLKESGLDYYNHNIDTSPTYYEKVVTTRQFSDRLDTLDTVRKSGIKVCCGGIMGLGESPADRLEFLAVLASMNPYPESVPINRLIPVEGTRLAKAEPINDIDLVRTIATARILMPKSAIRLTAGRTEMSDILQASCFYAGANSVFIGEVLLTEGNPMPCKDQTLFASLGLEAVAHGS